MSVKFQRGALIQPDKAHAPLWNAAHQLALDVHRTTKTFPENERPYLVLELRQCAREIPMQILKHQQFDTRYEQNYMLNYALQRTEELAYNLFLARDLAYLSGRLAQSLISNCQILHKDLTRFKSTQS